MKRINNKIIPNIKEEQFEGTTIGEEDIGEEEQIEYTCPECHRDLVKLSDRQGNNQDWFCKNCSISFPDIKQIQFKQKLTNPHYEDIEPAVSTTPTIEADAVAIRHELIWKGGFAQLAKKGTIKFTSSEEN